MSKLESIAIIVLLTFVAGRVEAAVKVVTTLPAYASIAAYVGADRVEVHSISRGDEDAHFVKPKPSFALLLKDADLFVTTGLDLELWAPTLVDKSGNREIRDGRRGFVNASQGVPLLDVPTSADRSAGDVHIFGNPHIFTSPLNAKIIATNIVAGLERVDPAGSDTYQRALTSFRSEIDKRVFGSELVGAIGGDVLDSLARQGKLIEFLESQLLEGQSLRVRLGGWLGAMDVWRQRKIVAYHKNWIYFTNLFDLEVVDYVEPKPGIPPSAKHVHQLIERFESEGIKILLAANYFSERQVTAISERTGCISVRVPMGPENLDRESYFDLVDLWVQSLVAAFEAGSEND